MQTPLPLFGSNTATPGYTHPPSPLPKMNATPAWKCLLHYAFMEHVQEYDSMYWDRTLQLSNSLVCKYLRSQKLDMHSVRNYMQKANNTSQDIPSIFNEKFKWLIMWEEEQQLFWYIQVGCMLQEYRCAIKLEARGSNQLWFDQNYSRGSSVICQIM